ncbi:hypothetical protein GTY67_34230 [Streptomyces sp. SID8374]|uniref:hypothetical protein n=1 Tax=Streptomyces sp. SID8374 TaxID=2690354 RepID=UPI00136C5C67|nr:hypothetical protein [Streptomyces sp. SID8374]MYX18408.1 hypothetical protein [Streptomyces sp. SID8374]
MTIDKQLKRAARELAAREGISYTAARRRLAAEPEAVVSAPLTPAPSAAGTDQDLTPPRLYSIARAVCATDCDGTAHPGVLCRPWRPEDSKAAQLEVQRAARLPIGRAGELCNRFEPPTATYPEGSFFARDAIWLLDLVYAMLTDQHPEFRPDRAELRAAVEADDQAPVDAVMEPLDRAAARLMTKVPEQWWGEVKPQLDAYADVVDTDYREILTWQEADDRDAVGRLVDKWRRRWTKSRNMNGYMEAPGVLWLAPKSWLDDLLVQQHGGHGYGARIRLTDGRPAIVYAAEWSEAGAPVAYRVRELEPGQYGNAGKLIPSFRDELVAHDQVAGELEDMA